MIQASWERNWNNLTEFFNYPKDIRRTIYTTNAIESLNFSLRKVTRNKSSFPDDNSIYKVMYPAGLCPLKIGDWLLISLQFYLTGVFPALINPCHLHTFYDRVLITYGQQFTMVFYFISASLFQAETVQFLYTGFLYRPAKVLYHL